MATTPNQVFTKLAEQAGYGVGSPGKPAGTSWQQMLMDQANAAIPPKVAQVEDASNRAEAEATANSTVPQQYKAPPVVGDFPVEVRDSAGNFLGVPNLNKTDADGLPPLPGTGSKQSNRVQDGRDGYSYDAWETYKKGFTDDWLKTDAGKKKMARQRKSLAKVMGVPVDQVTNQHVFNMGASTAAKRRGLLEQGGLDIPLVESDKLDITSALAGDNRNFRSERNARENFSVTQRLDNPLDNANFNAPWNRQGRDDYERGKKETEGTEVLSDRVTRDGSLLATAFDKVGLANYVPEAVDEFVTSAYNDVALGAADAAKRYGVGALNAIAGLAGDLVTPDGEAAITARDKELFKETRAIERKAEKLYDLQNTKMGKVNQISQVTAEAVSSLKGEPAGSAPVRVGSIGSKKEFVDQYMAANASPEELEMYHGKGDTHALKSIKTDKTVKTARGVRPDKRGVTKQSVKDDRFQSLKAEEKATSRVTDVFGETLKAVGGATPGKLIKGEEGFKSIRKTGSGTKLEATPLRNDAKDAAAKAEFARTERVVKKLHGEGKYVKATAKYLGSIGTQITQHPGTSSAKVADTLVSAMAVVINPNKIASIGSAAKKVKTATGKIVSIGSDVAKVAPEVGAKTATISGLYQDNYDQNVEEFQRLHKRSATNKELGVIRNSTAAATAVDVGMASLLVGKLGSKFETKLAKTLQQKVGMTAAAATAAAAIPTLEGGEELLVNYLNQYGTRQGLKERWDHSKNLQIFADGVIAAGGTRAILDPLGIPKAVVNAAIEGKGAGKNVAQKTGKILKNPAKGLLNSATETADKLTGGFVSRTKAAKKEERDAATKEANDAIIQDVVQKRTTEKDELADFEQRIADVPEANEFGEPITTTADKPVTIARYSRFTGKDLAAELGDNPTPEDIAELRVHAEALRQEYDNAFNSAIEDDVGVAAMSAEEQGKLLDVMKQSEAADALVAQIDKQQEAAPAEPVDPESLKTIEDVAGAIVRGNAPIQVTAVEGEAGRSAVGGKIKSKFSGLIQRLSNINAALHGKGRQGEVTREVLGTGTNAQGQLGAGAHLKSVAAAVLVGNKAAGDAALRSIGKFGKLQAFKADALRKGIAQYEATGTSTDVDFATDGSFNIGNSRSLGKAKNLLATVDKELNGIRDTYAVGAELLGRPVPTFKSQTEKAIEPEVTPEVAPTTQQTQPEQQAETEQPPQTPAPEAPATAPLTPLTDIPQVSKRIVGIVRDAGFARSNRPQTPEQIKATMKELQKVPGIGKIISKRLAESGIIKGTEKPTTEADPETTDQQPQSNLEPDVKPDPNPEATVVVKRKPANDALKADLMQTDTVDPLAALEDSYMESLLEADTDTEADPTGDLVDPIAAAFGEIEAEQREASEAIEAEMAKKDTVDARNLTETPAGEALEAHRGDMDYRPLPVNKNKPQENATGAAVLFEYINAAGKKIGSLLTSRKQTGSSSLLSSGRSVMRPGPVRDALISGISPSAVAVVTGLMNKIGASITNVMDTGSATLGANTRGLFINSRGKPILSLNDASDSPILLFMGKGEDGKPELFKPLLEAMEAVGINWLNTDGAGLMIPTVEDAYSSMGIDSKTSSLTAHQVNTIHEAGVPLKNVARRVGQQAVNAVGMDIVSDIRDGNLRDRLYDSVGMTLLNGMHQSGLVVISGLNNGFINEAKGIQSEPTDTFTWFVTVPHQLGVNRETGETFKIPATDDHARVRAIAQDPTYKRLMTRLVGKLANQKTTRASKIPANREAYRNKTTGKINEADANYVEHLNATPYRPNPLKDLLLNLGSPRIWAEAFGAIYPDPETGEIMDLPKHLSENQLSKNASIEREIELLKDAMAQRTIDHENLQFDIYEAEQLLANTDGKPSKELLADFRSKRDEVAALKAEGKDREATELEPELAQAKQALKLHSRHFGERARKKLEKRIARMKEELQGMDNDEFYFPHEVSSFGRFNVKSGDLNYMSHKVHRNTMSIPDHVNEIDLNDPEHLNTFHNSLIESIGLPPTEILKGTAQEWLMAKIYDNPVIQAGVDAMSAHLAGIEELEGGTRAEDIAAAVKELKEESHSLLALMDIANADAAGWAGKITMYGYVEVDGTNNGVASIVRQLVNEYDPEAPDYDADGELTDSGHLRRLLNATGQILEGQDMDQAVEYVRDNGLDAYQLMVVEAERIKQERISRVNLTNRDVAEIRTRITKSIAYGKEKGNEAKWVNQKLLRKFGKKLGVITDEDPLTDETKISIEAVRGILALWTRGNTAPELVVDGSVTNEGRTMAKGAMLPKIYASGDPAAARGYGNNDVDRLAATAVQMANIPEGKQWMDDYNAMLERLVLGRNVEPHVVTAENVREPLPPKIQKLLLQDSADGLGMVLVGGFNNLTRAVTRNTKMVTAASNAMAMVVSYEVNSRINKAISENDGLMPSAEEVARIKREAQEEGFFVGVQHINDAGNADAHSISDTVTEQSTGDERTAQGRRSKVHFRGKRSFGVRDSNGNLTESKSTSSMAVSLPEVRMSDSVKAKGTVGANIPIDGGTQAGNADADIPHGNLHDASTLGMLRAPEDAPVINNNWEDIQSADWSIMGAYADQLEALQPKYTEDELKWIFKDSPIRVGIEKYETFAEFVKAFRNTQIRNEVARSNIVVKDQNQYAYFEPLVRMPETSPSLTDVVESVDLDEADSVSPLDAVVDEATGSDTRGSAPVNPGSLWENADVRDVDGEVATRLYARTVANDANPPSTEHKSYLDEFFQTTILPMVQRVKNLTVQTASTDGSAPSGQVVGDTAIQLHTNRKHINQYASEMSDTEIMAHEFTHPLWVFGLRRSQRALNAARRLYKLADQVPEDVFLDPSEAGDPVAEAKAKQLYDYVTNDMHEFLTFGLTNERYRNALGQVATQKQFQNGTLPQRITALFKNILSRVGIGKGAPTRDGSGRANSTVDVELAKLAESFKDTAVSLDNKLWNNTVRNPAVKKGVNRIGDGIASPLQKWSTTSPDKVRTKASDFSARDVATNLAKAPIAIWSEHYQKALKDTVHDMEKGRMGMAAKIAKEIRGADVITRPIHNLLNLVNEHSDSAALRDKNAAIKGLKKAFNSDLRKSDWQVINKVWIGLDLNSVDASAGSLASMLASDKVLNSAITATLDSMGMSADMRKVVDQKAKALGKFMVDGTAKHGVHANGEQILLSTFGTNYTPRMVSAVESLASMYGIANTPDVAKDRMVSLVRENQDGFTLLRDMLDSTKEVVNVGPKGFVQNADDKSGKLVVKALGNHPGMNLVNRVSATTGLYSAGTLGYRPYQEGVVGIIGTQGVGAPTTDMVNTVLPRITVRPDGTLSTARNGQRFTTEKERRAGGLRTDTAYDIIGERVDRKVRTAQTGKFNKQAADLMKEDFARYGSAEPDSFIKIRKGPDNVANSVVIQGDITGKHREQAETFFAKLGTSAFKDMLGSDPFIPMRKDQLDLLIGFQKLSARDVLENNLGGVIPDPILGMVELIESMYQAGIKDIKKKTVLFTPMVVYGNQLSNMLVSVLFGMTPGDVLRRQKEGFIQIEAYVGYQKKDAELAVGKQTAKIKRQRAELKQAMESSGIHRLIQAGLFQSIIEDLDTHSEMGGLAGVVSSVLPQSYADKVQDKIEDMPKWARTAGSTILLKPSTELGRSVQMATAYADTVARYALYGHLTENGMSHEDALGDINDVFVNYAPNTSRGIQYLNDSGLLMYTKFLLRIQRVIFKVMRENPTGTIAMEMAQRVITGDLSDITDSNLVAAVGNMGGGRTVTPDEWIETVTTLPLVHLLKGLM